MIPVDIEGKANVNLAGREEDGLEAAIERFLGKGAEAVDKTAQQVLEGALRGVIAGVSPEEANTRRIDLAQEVAAHARQELAGLGIVLDFFQIQDLSDGEGYSRGHWPQAKRRSTTGCQDRGGRGRRRGHAGRG